MTSEQRTQVRKSLSEGYRGELTMQMDGRPLPLEAVVDVSSVGIGVITAEDIRSGSLVEVSYRFETINIDMSGVVVWTRRQDGVDDAKNPKILFAVGVSLTGPTLLYALL